MLTIWGRADSSNVQSVMWAVAELGLPHRRIDAGHRFGVNDTAEFLAMNPNGTVPVVQDGDDPPLFESAAILRYLCNRYAKPPFWPDAPAERAQVDMWAEWARLNVVVPFTQRVFTVLVRTPEAKRDLAGVAEALAALRPKLAIAEARLARHPWLAGADFTLADIQLGHLLYRFFTMDYDRPDVPVLRAYYDRLCTRPAYAEHVMVPYDALRA